jgi:hypothetical protein
MTANDPNSCAAASRAGRLPTSGCNSTPLARCSCFSADEIRFGIHGGAIETSSMLVLRPALLAELETVPLTLLAERPRRG